MNNYIRQYRPFLLFLLQFFGCYVLLIVLYQLYLNQFSIADFEIDGATQLVAAQSESMLKWFGYNVTLLNSDVEPSIIVQVNRWPYIKIIEGCNAVSVIILFTSFIVAFHRGFSRTFLFILLGVVLIHALNVLRIALLTIGLIKFPEYKVAMHDIVFPFFIYGVVFFLWVIWVNTFSSYGRRQ